jgi:hypothetical protein
MGNYYTHVGIIYRENNYSRPYIFEAWNPLNEKLFPSELSNGISFIDLKTRINGYRGYIFYKPLEKPIHPYLNEGFYNFIYWAVCNTKYNPNVFSNAINKLVFNHSLRIGTNCGEIVYMSLIKLGLLHPERFYQNRKYHLKWICNLIQTDTDNKYLPISYIWQEYFKIIDN